MSSSTNNVTKLASPLDWRAWEQTFLERALSLRISQYILGKQPWPQKPLLPELEIDEDFGLAPPSTITMTALESTARGSGPATNTRHRQHRRPPTTLSSTPAPGGPGPSTTATEEKNEREKGPDSQATHEELEERRDTRQTRIAIYNARMNIYRERHHEYQQAQSGVDILVKMIQETVSGDLRQTYCKSNADTGEESLQESFDNLRRFGRDHSRLNFKAARAQYQEAKKPLKNTKDVEKWIIKWEAAIRGGIEEDVPEATRPDIWLEDLCNAMQPVYDSWATTAFSQFNEEASNRTLRIADVLRHLRSEVQRRAGQSNTSKATRGAGFHAGQGTGSDQDDSNTGTSSSSRDTNLALPQRPKGKRPRQESSAGQQPPPRRPKKRYGR